MKKVLALLFSISFLSRLYAESLGEACLRLRAEVQAAQSEDLTPAAREALRNLGNPGEGSVYNTERVRMVLDSMGEVLPEKVRQRARVLVELGTRQAEEKSKALEAAAAKAIEDLVKAKDVAAIELLIQKTSTPLEEESLGLANPRTRTSLESLRRVNQLAQQWLSVFQAKEEGNNKKALTSLVAVRSQIDMFPTVGASRLRESIRLMVRSLGVPSAEVADKEIRSLLESVLAAKSPVEIDPILQKLRERQELWSAARDPSDGSIGSLAERASRFARTWQEYLAAKASDNSERARRALDTLTGEDLYLPGIARSMLLQRAMLEAPTKAQGSTVGVGARPSGSRFDQLLLSCKTLEDLDKLLPQLEDAGRQGNPTMHVPGPTNPFQILSELRAIDREYQDANATPFPEVAAARQPTTIRPGFGQPGVESPITRDLRQQLTLFVLAKHFRAPSQPNDSPSLYLRRRFLSARKLDDWSAVQRVLETASSLNLLDYVCLPSDASALTQYIAGVNYAEAGVARLAVASFLDALKFGSTNLPIADIKARLARIRSQEPAEYADGLELANRAPLPLPILPPRNFPQSKTDPTDDLKGAQLNLKVVSGSDQRVLPNRRARLPIEAKLLDGKGTPIAGALIGVECSAGKIARTASGEGARDYLAIQTDQNGKVQVYFRGPSPAGPCPVTFKAGSTAVKAVVIVDYNLPPASPTNCKALANDNGSFTITWQDNSDDEKFFIIERSTDQENWTVVGSVEANQTKFTDPLIGRQPINYYYRVISSYDPD